MTVTNTPFSGVAILRRHGLTLSVNSGGSLTASGCSFSLQAETLVAGSTLSLTNNTFGGTLYCTLPYVSQLTNNTSFGVVDISGGTLSQNVTLNVLGSGMTQYELDSNLTIAAGGATHLECRHPVIRQSDGVAVTVNGSSGDQQRGLGAQHYYNGNQSGFVVNSGGTMTGHQHAVLWG